jgi:4-amino-4-deoxy-L-arabinose transferase-like glycosyltransferase
MKHKLAISAVALSLVLQALYGVFDRAPDFDEAIYLNFARSIHQQFFPVAPQHPDVPFFRHPPLHYYVVAASTAVFGDSLAGARAGISILSAILLVVFYRWMSGVAPRSAGWATLLLAVNPAFLFYSHSAYMEITGALLMLLVVKELSRSEPSAGYLRAGLFMGLAFVTKYYTVTLAAAVGLYFLVAYRSRFLAGGRWKVFTAAAAVLGAWFAAAFAVDSGEFIAQTASWFERSSESVASWRSAGTIIYLMELAGVVTPVVAGLGLLGVVSKTRWGSDALRHHPHTVAAVFVLCHSVYLAVTPIKDIKYSLVIVPFLCGYAVWSLEPLCRRKWVLPTAAIVFAATATPAAHFPNPLDGSWQPNICLFSLQRDSEYRNYSEAGRFIRDHGGGTWLYSSERAAIVGYYAETSYRDMWWDTEREELAEKLETVPFVVLNANSPYFSGENRTLAETVVRSRFELVAEFPGESVDLSVWKRAGR